MKPLTLPNRMVALIPELRRKYMDPIHVAGPHGVTHQVVGCPRRYETPHRS
jgi:hypothetical protein